MPSLQQLIDQRGGVWSQMTSILDTADEEKRDLTSEERSTYDSAEADLDRLTGDIDRVQRHEGRSNKFDAPSSGGSNTPMPQEERNNTYDEAFGLWLRGGVADLEPEQRQALRFGAVDAKELRAQGVATNAGGGFLVPESYRNSLIEITKFYGAVQQVAEVITTDTGAVLPWPTLDDTANKGAILGENVQITEQDVVLTEAQLSAYKYTSKLTRFSLELIQDDAFDLAGRLPRIHGERIGRIWNEHFTTGTGVSQPEGIQTNAVVGVTGGAGQVTSITYDNLIDLEHSVDVSYRNERSRYMFHDSVLGTLRKLKDADGRPLWQPTLQAGVADSFNGRGYVINNDMPTPAANVKSVLFGDFMAGYVIRIVRGVQAIRLDERYADFLQVGFLSFARADARMQNSSAYRAYRQAAA